MTSVSPSPLYFFYPSLSLLVAITEEKIPCFNLRMILDPIFLRNNVRTNTYMHTLDSTSVLRTSRPHPIKKVIQGELGGYLLIRSFTFQIPSLFLVCQYVSKKKEEKRKEKGPE